MATSSSQRSGLAASNEKPQMEKSAPLLSQSSEGIPEGQTFQPSPSQPSYRISLPTLKSWSPEIFMRLLKSLFPFSGKTRHVGPFEQMKREYVSTSANRKKPLILVVGLGNRMFRDDGVGIHVVRELQKNPIPKIVYAEVGTSVLGSLHLFEWADKILAIDAMRAGGKPGTIYTIGINDVARPGPRASLNQQVFLSAFKFLSRKTPPEITILGIEPETSAYGHDLSLSVQASLSMTVKTVQKMVQIWLR